MDWWRERETDREGGSGADIESEEKGRYICSMRGDDRAGKSNH